jgi:hypothetical protein
MQILFFFFFRERIECSIKHVLCCIYELHDMNKHSMVIGLFVGSAFH